MSSRIEVSSRAGFGDVHASDVHASVVPLEDESRQQIRRGEYGQWQPKEGYYARAFVKTRRAPAYHYKSVHAPFLSSETGGVARLPDQTGRFANAPERERLRSRSGALRFVGPERRNYKKNDARSRSDSYDSYDSYDSRNSYGAQQNVFLARRAAFERARGAGAGRRSFWRFPMFNDERRRSARFRRDEHLARGRRISSRPAVRREKGLRRGRVDAPRASERRAERGAGAGARRAARDGRDLVARKGVNSA